jgi:hypothetical protein
VCMCVCGYSGKYFFYFILSTRFPYCLSFSFIYIYIFFYIGEEKFVSAFYIIENMDRHKGGTYICTANNGVGQVATSQIVLHVLCKLCAFLFIYHILVGEGVCVKLIKPNPKTVLD